MVLIGIEFKPAHCGFAYFRYAIIAIWNGYPVDENSWRRFRPVRFGDEPRKPRVCAKPQCAIAITKAAIYLIIGKPVCRGEMLEATGCRVKPVQPASRPDVETSPLVLCQAQHMA